MTSDNGKGDSEFVQPLGPQTLPESNSGLRPVPISKLARSGSGIQWAWEGFLSLCHVTLLVGLWKCGKSTLLAHLLKAFCTGGDLGGRVTKSRVLLLTEESAPIWADRRDELGIGDDVDVVCRPFFRRPSPKEWHDVMGDIAEMVAKEDGYRVVILDPLPNMWPVTHENDASEVGDAMLAIQRVAHAGAAVLLLHHPAKAEATEGRAARGSGALAGFCDVIVEFRRFDPQRREDRRRVLTTYSRFPESPDTTVLALTDQGYVAEGTRADVKRADRISVVMDMIGEHEMTLEALLKAWPSGDVAKPGLRTLRNDLQHAFEEKMLARSGDGRKGRAYLFSALNGIPATQETVFASKRVTEQHPLTREVVPF